MTERRRLSVVFIVVGWPGRGEVGGGARYVFRLATALAPLVDLTIVTSAGGIPVPGARMIQVPEWRSRFGHYYGFPLKVRRIVRDLAPDVVHAFGDDWALDSSAHPLVRTFLGSSLSEARSSKGLRAVNHYILALLERLSQQRADVRVGIGPESFEMFDAHHLMAPVAPLAVAAEPRTPTREPSVVFLGAWSGRKRGQMAHAAVQHAREALGAGVRLTVFGAASDADNWPSSVDHVSGASDAAVQTAIRSAWLLVAPSAYEGFGIPAFEAMALGVPVVATPNPGSDYLASTVDCATAFAAVSEAEFSKAVTSRLAAGPLLNEFESRAVSRAVSSIYDGASADYLVEQVYLPAVNSSGRRGDRE